MSSLARKCTKDFCISLTRSTIKQKPPCGGFCFLKCFRTLHSSSCVSFFHSSSELGESAKGVSDSANSISSRGVSLFGLVSLGGLFLRFASMYQTKAISVISHKSQPMRQQLFFMISQRFNNPTNIRAGNDRLKIAGFSATDVGVGITSVEVPTVPPFCGSPLFNFEGA